jgi:hypothetical protein
MTGEEIMRTGLVALLSFAVIGVGGCSSGIKVTHLQGDLPVQGNPWNLAMTQFAVTITRHVVACGSALNGTVEVIATPSAVMDEDQRYVLESNGWWGTSDITSNLATNGTSTGLNAQSADSTAKIISNVVGTVGQVAIAGATGVAAAGAKPVCEQNLAKAVRELYPPKGSKAEGLKERVDDAIAELAASTAKVTLLTQQATLDKGLRKALVAALEEQSKLQKALADAQEGLASALKLTTNTQTIRWPLRSSVFRVDTPFSLAESVLKSWINPDLDDEGMAKAIAQAKPQFEVYLAIFRPDLATEKWVTPTPAVFTGASVGVPVRLARTGRLLACVEEVCHREFAVFGSPNRKHIAFDQVVLQIGQIYTVPLTGGSFRSQTAVVALDPNGLPTSIQVSEKVAAGEALTGAFKDAATQYAELPAKISAAKLAATKAQTDQLAADASLAAAQANAGVVGETAPLVAQTALINAQNALAKAKADAGTQQTAEITAQTAMLNAQAALITAQANAATGQAVGALNAQTALINAEAAQVNAAAALAKAKAAAAIP